MTMPRLLSGLDRLMFCSFLLTVALAFPTTSRAQLLTDAGQTNAASQMSQQIAELQKVVDRWDDAIDQHDQYGLELVLAPQFIAISDSGQVQDRDQVVSQLVMKDAPRYTLAQKVTSVRIVGDVAVINGTYDRVYQGSRLSRTKRRDEKGVFSQVYVRARNSWECINSQRTLIEGAASSGSRKKSKEGSDEKRLNHDLGFHFPGMHHNSSNSGSQPQ